MAEGIIRNNKNEFTKQLFDGGRFEMLIWTVWARGGARRDTQGLVLQRHSAVSIG